MKFRHIFLASTASIALGACGQGASEGADAQADAASATEAANAQQETETFQTDAISGVYAPDVHHRYISFSYLHQGYSRPILNWDEWTGELNWNAEAPEDSSVSITIDVNSIDSGVVDFDGHLTSADWFNAAEHPEITFVSTEVEKTGADTGTITGDLTIKGVTKPATLDVLFRKGAYVERGNLYKLGFSAETTVKRSDFDLGAYVPYVGDEIDIRIETEWEPPAPESE